MAALSVERSLTALVAGVSRTTCGLTSSWAPISSPALSTKCVSAVARTCVDYLLIERAVVRDAVVHICAQYVSELTSPDDRSTDHTQTRMVCLSILGELPPSLLPHASCLILIFSQQHIRSEQYVPTRYVKPS